MAAVVVVNVISISEAVLTVAAVVVVNVMAVWAVTAVVVTLFVTVW